MTLLGQQLVHSIQTKPEQWTQEDCIIKHINGTQIWTANVPVLDLTIYYPNNVSLTWSDKWHIFWAIRQRNRIALQNLWSNS